MLISLSQREVASKGGKASSGSFKPGDPRAREAGKKGGRSSRGGRNTGNEDEDEEDDDE